MAHILIARRSLPSSAFFVNSGFKDLRGEVGRRHEKIIKRHIRLHGKRRFFRLEFHFLCRFALSRPPADTRYYSMILVLSPDTRPDSSEYKQLLVHLANLPGISTRVHS